VKQGTQYFNRLIWMQPDGEYDFYDKRHLFRMAKEHESYNCGATKIIKNIKGWNICPLICYDLRFPVWSRNINLEYDLLIYVANWPQVRSTAWKTLLQARAIENISYVAGVNRVGKDGNDIYYSGDSAVVNFKGDKMIEISDQEELFTTTLNRKELIDFRKKFPANLDADNFQLLE
jgi:predicted amidohydrolase